MVMYAGGILAGVTVVVLLTVAPSDAQYFSCPPRCQCYADPVDSTRSMHLICKWEQLNASNLESITATDPVRTLTIRCPHGTKTVSNPPQGLFRHLSNLDRLEIERCLMGSLPSRLFQGMGQLYSLIIRNAGITQLPRDIFVDLTNLMALDLAGNQLRIEPYAVSALNNLIQLDLSNNSINFLSSTLVTLKRLKVLSLDENSLSNIDLRRLPSGLTDLTVRNNRINTVHYTPDSVDSLRRLDFSGNQLDFISAAGNVNALPVNLWSVDLTNNRISYVQDGAFAMMSKLTIVDLRNNSLNELREQAMSSKAREHRLRVLLTGNPLNCVCSLRWMVHTETKTSAMVVDLADVQCKHILRDERMSLSDADTVGDLLCRYEASCAEQCTCCFQHACHCRSNCPEGCTCWHSANPKVSRMGRNIVECKGVRLDHLKGIPESVTELRLPNGRWSKWSPSDIGPRRDLLVLNLTATKLGELNENFLDGFPRLTELDLSSNELDTFPDSPLDGVVDLQALFLNDNNLSELSDIALRRFAVIGKLKLGGRSNVYACDCQLPSALQRWLLDEANIRKVVDYADVYCRLWKHGVVRIKRVNPMDNESLCSPVTTTTTTQRPTTTSTTTPATSTPETVPTVRLSTSRRPARRRFFATTAPGKRDEVDLNSFFGYLMVFLVLLLICLLITIAATVYFRYCHMKQAHLHKTHKRIGKGRTKVEQQPLNGV